MSITENNLLVVDEDDNFIDQAKRLFDGRLPTVRSVTEAVAAVEGGELRMVLIGPSIANEESIDSVRTLRNEDPSLILIGVADEVTSVLLRAAMRAGMSEVIEAPLTEEKIEEAIKQFANDVLKRRTVLTAVVRGCQCRSGFDPTATAAVLALGWLALGRGRRRRAG